ncbi:GntR family transcriptional regulator [Streptomyces sp. NPDC058401]|uniref:GntR family transcriptional regulator n=1 Tax=Streptomyces sp. NPDC058401 TaxID=3346480 RepID=UPI003660A6CC
MTLVDLARKACLRRAIVEALAVVVSAKVLSCWYGTRLPAERALAVEFAVNRQTVRAALPPGPDRDRRPLRRSAHVLRARTRAGSRRTRPLPAQAATTYSTTP